MRAVTERYKKSGREVIDIDGARIQFGKPGEPAWGLVRASNTGPVLVMRFEAGSEKTRDAIHAAVMLNHKVNSIATFDKGFDQIPGIQRAKL